MDRPRPDLRAVRQFWEEHPVAASAVPFQCGTPAFFAYYDRLREANESPAFSAALHEFTHFSGKRVLDVGCGNGYVLGRYAEAGARVHGVDLTRTAVELCRRRFEIMNLAGRFVVGDAEHLPFAAGAFDCVCSMGVLHHTPDTPMAVREAFRVLRPGGRLVAMFYHRDSLQYRVKFPLVKWLKGIPVQESVNRVDGRNNPKGDVYSRAELVRLLGGFEGLELFAGVLPWHKMPRLSRVIPSQARASLERSWGWFLYAKGTRPA